MTSSERSDIPSAPAPEPPMPPVRSSAPVRTIGTVFYLLGLVGLVLLLFLLWYGTRIRYVPEPPSSALPALGSRVEAIVDGSGTWHLRGADLEDLLAAEGWVHATERFTQMEIGRLVARGRISEVIGSVGLPVDRLFRTLGLAGMARRQVTDLPPDVRRRLDSYVRGVNARLADERFRLPPALVLAGREPEPWTLEDSALMLALMALSLSGNAMGEAVTASLESRFAAEDVALLLPPGTPAPPLDGEVDHSEAGGSGVGNNGERVDAAWQGLATAVAEVRDLLGVHRAGMGSSAWVLSGAFTASGQLMLGNDPHLAATIPPLFFSIGLHLPDHDLVGVSVPGVPGVVLGRSGSFAWAFTAAAVDDQDLYLERPDPADPLRYLFTDTAEPFSVRSETLRVRWGASETITVRGTRHGPVISDVLEELVTLQDAGERTTGALGDREGSSGTSSGPQGVRGWAGEREAVALRWGYLEGPGTLRALDGLLLARSLSDVRDAMEHFTGPAQHVLLADTSGTIAYRLAARVPVRRGWDGTRPVPGWTGAFEWAGYLSFDALPEVTDPSAGFIVSANGPPPVARGTELGVWWPPRDREARLQALIASGTQHTFDTLALLMTDLLAAGSDEVIAALGALPEQGPALAEVVALLSGWDRRVDGQGPSALYEAFLERFFPLVLGDELGREGLRDYVYFLEEYEARQRVIGRLLEHQLARWWDDTRTPEREGSGDILEAAARAALEQVRGRWGPDPADWRWEEDHLLVLEHPLGTLGPLAGLTNRGPYAMPGNGSTLLRNYGPPGSTRIRTAAIWRHVVELGPSPAARAVLLPGNSGHFLSPHYDDQLEEWLAGRLPVVPTSWEEVVQAATIILYLIP